ncbi:MAG: helix-turn-helix domain-containing protein [Acetobacteraceae bacterium]
MDAAALLGVSQRTFRRWSMRFDDSGEAGLLDLRGPGQFSAVKRLIHSPHKARNRYSVSPNCSARANACAQAESAL